MCVFIVLFLNYRSNISCLLKSGNRDGRDRMVVELAVQSVSITTKVVSSNPIHSRKL